MHATCYPQCARRCAGTVMLLRLLAALMLMTGCTPQVADTLEEIKQRGELRVLTRNTGTTYYEGPEGPAGVEYDLALGFSRHLGVTLKLIVEDNVGEIIQGLIHKRADLAAAGLTITQARKTWARFTPPYQSITQQLVYRSGNERPSSLHEIDGNLQVAANSSHSERLYNLQPEYPELKWREDDDAESEELLTAVWDGSIDYTVADSHELAITRRYYPELRVAFNLGAEQQLAWAFNREQQPALYDAAVDYFRTLREDGTLELLLERYYGHLVNYDYVGTRTFFHHYHKRFDTYRDLLRREADKQKLNWLLLAAVAYQESHWNPNAVSPTGVRGFMMLTKATAKQMKVSNRRDAAQSIRGGAAYLRHMIDKVPDRIAEPDRIWLALAAYNVGFGHLEDARILTEKSGGDPDNWKDVKRTLPLLRKKRWYRQTRHGYARGDEAAQYVENIRSYFDILSWLEDKRDPATLTAAR